MFPQSSFFYSFIYFAIWKSNFCIFTHSFSWKAIYQRKKTLSDFWKSFFVLLFLLGCVHTVMSMCCDQEQNIPWSPFLRHRAERTLFLCCFVFALPLELSRQDISHTAENGLVLPRPFQVELEAADAAALIARLLGFCGHGWFLWKKKQRFHVTEW